MNSKTDNKNLRNTLSSIINNSVIPDEDALEKVATKLQLTEYRKIIDVPATKLNATEVYTTLQKYDIVRTIIGPTVHYAIVDCGIIDNIVEFKEVLTAVKHYYKDLLKGNSSK